MEEYQITKCEDGYADYRIDRTIHVGGEGVHASDIIGVDSMDYDALVPYGDYSHSTEVYRLTINAEAYAAMVVPKEIAEFIAKNKECEIAEGTKMKATGICHSGIFMLCRDRITRRQLPLLAVHYHDDFDTQCPEKTKPYAISILVPVKLESESQEGWAVGSISLIEDKDIEEIFNTQILPFKIKNRKAIEDGFIATKGHPDRRMIVSSGHCQIYRERCPFYEG